MSILSKIKSGVKKSGSNKGKLLYLKPDSKTRVRFLHEIESGIEVRMHDSFDRGVNVVCQTHFGKDCDYCEDETLRTREAYVWAVWDYDAKEVKLFLGHANNFSPLPALIAMYESYGTIMDRDYILQRDGAGTGTRYSVVPMDKVKFTNSKAKPYSEKKMLDILNKAFPADDAEDDEEEEDEETPKQKALRLKKEKAAKAKAKAKEEEDEEDDEEEENEYDDMSPKELYMECIERGLKAKKKQKAVYYVDMLLENDIENEEEDEGEDDDW